MPGNYERISTRKSWSDENMIKAIEAVKENKMGWLSASKQFNVPQATLRRHFCKVPENLGRFKPIFNADMEKELVEHILEFERRFYGISATEIRKLAYEYAEKLGLKYRFDRNRKIAGWDWFKGFKKRNPIISIRASEAKSTRIRPLNKSDIMKFFSLLEKTVAEDGIQGHRIYSMDEREFSTEKPPEVFAIKGKKQVGAVTRAERGEHFTIVACANAIGDFIPPALIIPKKNHRPEYFDGSPPGTLELCYPPGCMASDLFLTWMRHFISYAKASVTNEALLILVGHSSQKNLHALELAKANGVIVICLPPRSTYRMKPLKVSFFGSFQTCYDQEIAAWIDNNPGETLGLCQIAQIFGKAYKNAAVDENITSGFKKSGIYPFNRHIFSGCVYSSHEVIKSELNDDDDPIACSSSQSCLDQVQSDSTDDQSIDIDEQKVAIVANSQKQIDYDADATSQVAEDQSSSLSPQFYTVIV